MHDSFDITTIVFAFLAVFVIWKLRSVLGTRTGSERQRPDVFTPRTKAAEAGTDRPYAKTDDNNVIRLPGAPAEPVTPTANPPAADPDRWKAYAEPDSKVWEGLDAINAADTSFDPGPFIAGAKGAYEMIVSAFAAGDRKTLRNLLAKDVYDNFAGAISTREQRGEKMETTFVSIDKTTIEDAQLRAGTASVTLRILSKLITATRDKAGTVVEGNPEKVVDMVDLWTFARDVNSRDPNWKLVTTDTGH